jgi:hypothetical protein
MVAFVFLVCNDLVPNHKNYSSRGVEQAWLSSNPFVKIRHAFRLIVLAQPSSAATERVFSQLQFIRRVSGNAMMEDVVCMRNLVRCNQGHCDDFELY